MIPWVAATDSHGDLEHRPTTRALLKFCDVFKPEVRIHLGDAYDLRALRNGASDDEKSKSMRADVERGSEFLREFQPTVFMFGNHDHRLVEQAARAKEGVLRDWCRELHDGIMEMFAEMGTQVYPYDVEKGVHRFGGWNWLHGYNANMHAAAKAAQIYGNCFMGHVHTLQVVGAQRHGGATGITLPCLMDIGQADYARRRPATLGWRNGWAYGWASGDSLVYNFALPLPDGSYRIPLDFAEVA